MFTMKIYQLSIKKRQQLRKQGAKKGIEHIEKIEKWRVFFSMITLKVNVLNFQIKKL